MFWVKIRAKPGDYLIYLFNALCFQVATDYRDMLDVQLFELGTHAIGVDQGMLDARDDPDGTPYLPHQGKAYNPYASFGIGQ